MKIELLILAITGFLIANAYYDGKYLRMIQSWKKYYQMGFIGFAGISLYLFMKKNPTESQSLLVNASNIITHMPIDRNSGDLLKPLLSMNDLSHVMSYSPQYMRGGSGGGYGVTPQQKRMMNSGKTGTKRSVSETKKKFVASQQNWKCGHCDQQLTAWFEVDHSIRLDQGGTNEVSNLVALCRECHGKKTTIENL